MAIEPIKGFYVHDEETNTDGVAQYDYNALANVPFGDNATEVSYKTRPGYITVVGDQEGPGSDTQEVYTNKIPCFPGDTFTIDLDWNGSTLPKWVAFATFNKDGRFIARNVFGGWNTNATTATLTTPAIPDGAYYVAFTYRTYGDCTANIKYEGSYFDIRNRVNKGLLYAEISGEWDTILGTDSESLSNGVLKLGYRPISDFIHVAGKTLVVEKDASYTSVIMADALYFDGDKNYLFNSGWKQTSATFEPPTGAVYVRIMFDATNQPNTASGSPTAETVRENTRIYTTQEVDFDAIAWAFNENVKGVNHRGYNTAPENTLPAYKLSKQVGFTYCETDVSMTSDRVPVLLHDETINRTARNADGTEISETINIGSITYEQALTYDFGIYKGAQYAGTKIPTFAQFIKLCKNLGLHPYIELKSGGGYTESEIQGLVDIVRQNGMDGKVTWISFSSSLLTYVKNYDASARLGFIVGALTSANITTASSLKTTTNEVFLDVSSIADVLVDDCITAGLPVEVWTINSTSGITALNDYISGVTSDNLIASKVLYEANI